MNCSRYDYSFRQTLPISFMLWRKYGRDGWIVMDGRRQGKYAFVRGWIEYLFEELG